MYCYTMANNLGCILTELRLWSNTSKEHPTFILTIADLTNKDLSRDLEDDLRKLHDQFEMIEDKTMELQKNIHNCYMVYNQIPALIKKFLRYNHRFLRVLDQLQRYGKEDKVWQTLLEHIEDEQRYMEKTFKDILYQL